ncbi:17632_t:CDS:2, partial [Cetraspora pellucida]
MREKCLKSTINKWKRKPQIEVCLKSLDNSKDKIQEFLKEVEIQYKHGGYSAIAIYGITKNPKDNNYIIVMEYAKQGSLRKLLNSKHSDLDWNEETELYKQVKEIKDTSENSSTYNEIKSARHNFQTHKQAIFISRLLNFSKLPKAINKSADP